MTTNPNGVEYEIKPDGDTFSVIVLDVTTPVELPGFATHKCAHAFAVALEPIINKELLHEKYD